MGVVSLPGCHTFRYSFVTHLLESGYDIYTIQELLGHEDVKTIMIYTHVLNRGGQGVRSPLDLRPSIQLPKVQTIAQSTVAQSLSKIKT